MTDIIRMICKHCGSDHLTRDASAVWDVGVQGWILAGVQDRSVCEDCGRENTVIAVPIGKAAA